MIITKTKYQNIFLKTFSKNNWKSFGILLVGIILTISAAIYTKNDLEMQLKHEFALVCNEIKTKITTRLYSHAQLLRSGSSFFAASDTITRQEWKKYYGNSKLDKNLPGIQGFGFSVIIKKEQLQQHVQNIQKEGFPEYAMRPAGDREIYTSIIYLEPFTDRNLRAFGFDMYSEPIRRKAMEQARDFDVAALSGKVILVQETDKDLQAGTLMYVPVYRNGLSTNTIEERRAAIIGWVYSPYRMFDLMQGILGRWDLNDNNKIHLQVYDNDRISQNSLLFDSQKKDTMVHNDKPNQTLTIPIVFNEKKWTLHFSQSNGQFSYFQSKVLIVLFSGFIISILLFSLLQSLFNTRLKAQQIAAQLTSELKESEKRFSLFMDYLPAIVFLKDNEGKTLFVNKFMDNAVGASKWLGKNMVEVFPNEFGDKLLADDLRVMKLGYEKIEESIHFFDGLEHFFETQKFIIPQQAGEPFLGGISLDITERRQMELILIEKNEEIATQNEELSQTNQELFTAKEEVENSNEKLLQLNADKDRFISILAHDLKSPFNSILGFLSLLTKNIHKYDIEKIEKQLNIINNSAQNTFKLLEDILMWVRANSGKIPFEPQNLSIGTICNEVIENLKLTANAKNITINHLATDEITVFADKNMLNTVLRNLVSNSIKFTNKNGRIDICAEKTNINVIITVSDNGIGIEPDTLNKLFNISQKISTVGTESEKGTGLGLALCKEFVEKHSGKIWVESELGIGSDFKFTMPLFVDSEV